MGSIKHSQNKNKKHTIMKHLLLTLALMAAVPTMAAEENDTTIHYANKQIVLSTDSVSLNVAVYNNDGSTLVKTKETSFVDGQEVERFFVSSPFVPVRKKSGRTFYGSLPDFYIGVNLLNGGKEMHSQDVKSLEWGTTFFQVGVGLNSSNTLGIVSGFQFGFVHNHFQTNYMLDDNDGTPIIVKNPAEKVKTSFIKYTYWKVPIMLEWRNLNPSKLVFLGLGCSFSFEQEVSAEAPRSRAPISRVTAKFRFIRFWFIIIGLGETTGGRSCCRCRARRYSHFLPFHQLKQSKKPYPDNQPTKYVDFSSLIQ